MTGGVASDAVELSKQAGFSNLQSVQCSFFFFDHHHHYKSRQLGHWARAKKKTNQTAIPVFFRSFMHFCPKNDMMYAPKKLLTRSWPQSKMLFAFRSLLKSGGAMDIKLRQCVHELNDLPMVTMRTSARKNRAVLSAVGKMLNTDRP